MARTLARRAQVSQEDARAVLKALTDLPPAQFDTPGLHAALTRAKDYLGEADKRPEEPVRTIHHLACTGGTLISKALAAMPNTVLLSEIDPLSTMHLRRKNPPFAPTDLIVGLRYAPRHVSEETILNIFAASLRATRADLARQGFYLVLRDHAHSQFCTRQDRHARQTMHQIVSGLAPVRSVVTVRHPLDSFLSLRNNGWVHYTPDTLEEYCRRYLDFLEAHGTLPVVKYETFVEHPAAAAADLCDKLALPFEPDFEICMALARLTGDSGRTGTAIRARPQRFIAAALWEEMRQSTAYETLCDRLNYEQATDEQNPV